MDPESTADVISLTAFQIETIVGILPSERVTPQPLDVEISLELDVSGAEHGDLDASVNYADVERRVRFLVREGKFRLIESLALGICRMLLADRRVQAVRVRLAKPTILDHSVPSLSLRRDRAWAKYKTTDLASGLALEIVHTDRVAAWWVALSAGDTVELPEGVACQVDEGEVAWSGGRARGGGGAPRGRRHRAEGDDPGWPVVGRSSGRAGGLSALDPATT